jgi:YD repeat-containing protein
MNRLFGKYTVFAILCGVLLPFPGYSATLSYQYDQLSRLTAVHYGDGTLISYVYDPAGNRLSMSITGNANPIGDINGDGFIDIGDAILSLQVLSGQNPAGIRSGYAGSGADVGGNQKIGMEEAIYIVQKVAGIR